jgi:hypothetical protein
MNGYLHPLIRAIGLIGVLQACRGTPMETLPMRPELMGS